MTTLTWIPRLGTPNFYTATGWTAVYTGTVKGYACYKTFSPSGLLHTTGGLPLRVRVLPVRVR